MRTDRPKKKKGKVSKVNERRVFVGRFTEMRRSRNDYNDNIAKKKAEANKGKES